MCPSLYKVLPPDDGFDFQVSPRAGGCRNECSEPDWRKRFGMGFRDLEHGIFRILLLNTAVVTFYVPSCDEEKLVVEGCF